MIDYSKYDKDWVMANKDIIYSLFKEYRTCFDLNSGKNKIHIKILDVRDGKVKFLRKSEVGVDIGGPFEYNMKEINFLVNHIYYDVIERNMLYTSTEGAYNKFGDTLIKYVTLHKILH